eukprot:jgi/Undpi1/13639/HiC_scaffold_9.g03293.m1
MAPSPSPAMVTARAEQGTLEALAVPRVTVGKNPFIKSQAGLTAVARPETEFGDLGNSEDALLRTPETARHRQGGDRRLPALPSAGQRARKETLREIDEVRMLHHQPLEPKLPRSGFEKLHRKQADRRERDARAIKAFDAGVAAISEDMEQRVLEASYALRDSLGEADDAISATRKELDVDGILVQGDMAYVEEMWSKLEAQCKHRSRCIEEFRGSLEGIEIRRSGAVGEELRHLVDEMVAIACKMPDEIERIAEEHVAELNGVLISNRLAHAELLAAMEKRDFAVAVGVRRAWEVRRDDWRRLRHDRAVGQFHSDLCAPNFTNPPERVLLFRAFKEGQALRHGKRVALLRDLCRRRPLDKERGVAEKDANEGTRLTTAVVSEFRERYTALHKEEIDAILETQEGLARVRDAKLEESEARREALRAELHSYGALSPEPDLEGCCGQVEAVAHSLELEEFMRKAGGLKNELLALVQGMRSPEIVYDACLSVAVERTELLLCGVEVEGVLDKQGKTMLRRGLVDSVERLRKSPKSEIPSILAVLRRQAADLAQVSEIDPLLASSLERVTEDIDSVVSTIVRRGGGSGGGSGAARSVGSRVSKRSGVGSSRGAGRTARSGGSGGGSSAAGSRSMGSSSRGGSSRGGGGWESEIEIDMIQVRAVQRRVGLLASASDLSEEFKQELRGVRAALEQQRVCNAAVDRVVSEEADDELASRLSEQSQLLERSIRSMDARAQELHACAERVCAFFAALSAELEAHEEKKSAIDEAGEQRMFDRQEDFRLDDEDREALVKACTDRVRMAAGEEELEASFARVVALLDEVEGSYREYHKGAYSAALIHPTEAEQEAQRTRAAICSLLGLQPPSESDEQSLSESVKESVKHGTEGGEEAEDGAEGGEGEDGKEGERVGEETEDKEADNEDPNSQEENEPDEQEAEEEAEDVGLNMYRAPESGEVAYFVDQTPEKIASELLIVGTAEEEDEDDNQSGSDAGAEGDESKNPKDAAGNPSYWRGSFVPLGEEELQAMKQLPEGEEALEEYFVRRDRRFRDLTEEERDLLRIASEAETAARARAKEEAAKKAKKNNKKGGAKGKKAGKGAASPLPAGEDPTQVEVEPPSILEAYDAAKREVEQHRALRKEEIARLRAEERLVPRDPTGEAVMEELTFPLEETSTMIAALRDDLMTRTERRSAARKAAAEAACQEAQEILTEELEERLRKHWPRKGRTELSEQERSFGEELTRMASKRESFQKALAGMTEALADATSVAALQGMESRCKKLVASLDAEHEALLPRLEKAVEDEPARLLASCDDVRKLCRRFAEGGDYDDQELNELEELLQEPRKEVALAAESRREALVQATAEHKSAIQGKASFKEEHTRCVMVLSLREGLGQRYGAPRRKAQERIRSVMMRDESCGDTIQRLLDGLEDLLRSRRLGVDGDGDAWKRPPTVLLLPSPAPCTQGSPRDNSSGRKGGSKTTMAALDTVAVPNNNRSLTDLLRSSLLSIREALFRHASFLEFLPAPERIDRKRVVQGEGAMEGGIPGGLAGDESGQEKGGGEELDPEVALMPQEGETFAGALDSLETRCRSETRLLYESEGKQGLLAEEGVPESLKIWLEESRKRAMSEGGHREGARRRLRSQVERFELLIAKRPVPRDVSVGPRAPALMLLDLSARLEQAASNRRRKIEVKLERVLAVSAAARAKHQRLLRPAFGSADRRDELEELLSLEAARAADARGAMMSYRQELLEEEAAVAREYATKVAACFRDVTAILDSVVMADDLGRLPEDDDLEPKRKGLRRLRKADRAFLKQQNQAADSKPPAVGGGGAGERRKSAGRVSPPPSGIAPDKGGEEESESRQGRGRYWARRSWKATGLTDLSRVLLAAGATAAAAASAAAGAVTGDAVTVDFNTILDGMDLDVTVDTATDPATAAAAPTGKNGGGGGSGPPAAKPRKSSKKEKKGVGKGKGAAAAVAEEEESAEAVARRHKEAREADVKGWVEALTASLEVETFVTTAHRAVVATRDTMLNKLADRTKEAMVELQERYGKMLDAEVHWGTKWKQLVDMLVSNDSP